jgi:uncharacterized protein
LKIAYVDSSIIVRYYLPNDPGHPDALSLFEDDQIALVTATLTHIEVSGALVRAARNARVPADDALARFDSDLELGTITLVGVDNNDDVEQLALHIVRTYGIRALDAIHIATAQLVLPELTGPGDVAVFISRDGEQAAAAEQLGLTVE